LSDATVGTLASHIARPCYDRSAQKEGIVHFGIGAFHRAHQATYTEDAMAAGDRNWAITGVSLRSADVREQMHPQNGLYSVTERSPARTSIRVIGSVKRVLVASESAGAVIAALAAPHTHIVTFTITEKGYHGRADGTIDLHAANVAHDLSGRGDPRTIYGYLARALARRRADGLGGLTLLSCDNLAENGKHLAAHLTTFLHAYDSGLSEWFRSQCACPSTMVDRIVPATAAADRDIVDAELALRDEAAVITEPFRQWVIEDRFAGPRPRWEAGGAQFVSDVRPYESAKLRMLNGAHSAMAYLGVRRGHEYAHQAIADPAIRALVKALMREAAATLAPLVGFDSERYMHKLLERFENSALPHRLRQIAMDGSQKIPQRWLQAIACNRAAGRDCPATLRALAAWMLYVRGDVIAVDDPMAARLASLWRESGEDGIAAALFGSRGLFAATWTAAPADQVLLRKNMAALAASV
jgi:fructuronate reductase